MCICLLANHLFLLSLAVLGLHCRTDFSAVVASEGFSCCHPGFSLQWPLLWSRASRAQGPPQFWQMGSAVAVPGLQSTDSILVARGLTFFHSTWDLPRSRIKLLFPALAGGFFTTKPPGKPLDLPFVSNLRVRSGPGHLSNYPLAFFLLHSNLLLIHQCQGTELLRYTHL